MEVRFAGLPEREPGAAWTGIPIPTGSSVPRVISSQSSCGDAIATLVSAAGGSKPRQLALTSCRRDLSAAAGISHFAGCSCTSSRRRHAMLGTPTSSVRPSTAPSASSQLCAGRRRRRPGRRSLPPRECRVRTCTTFAGRGAAPPASLAGALAMAAGGTVRITLLHRSCAATGATRTRLQQPGLSGRLRARARDKSSGPSSPPRALSVHVMGVIAWTALGLAAGLLPDRGRPDEAKGYIERKISTRRLDPPRPMGQCPGSPAARPALPGPVIPGPPALPRSPGRAAPGRVFLAFRWRAVSRQGMRTSWCSRVYWPSRQARYSSSVTCSPHSMVRPSPSASCTARWVMNVPGPAPCQTASPLFLDHPVTSAHPRTAQHHDRTRSHRHPITGPPRRIPRPRSP